MDSFPCSPLFLFIHLSIYLFQDKLPEVPEYATVQFHIMKLLDVLGKIAWVRQDFLSQGKISDIFIRCARNTKDHPKFIVLNQKVESIREIKG